MHYCTAVSATQSFPRVLKHGTIFFNIRPTQKENADVWVSLLSTGLVVVPPHHTGPPGGPSLSDLPLEPRSLPNHVMMETRSGERGEFICF
jgi:hypothetical protein